MRLATVIALVAAAFTLTDRTAEADVSWEVGGERFAGLA